MTVVEAGARQYTPEDLLRMPDGDRYELVDGQLVERKMGWKLLCLDPACYCKSMILWVTTRRSNSLDLRRAVLARKAEPRLRLIIEFTVSLCHL